MPPNVLAGRPMYFNAAPTRHFNAAPTVRFNSAPTGHFNAAPTVRFNAAPTEHVNAAPTLDIINNVSDHYPILAEINFEFSIGSIKLKSSKRDQMHCKVNWNKLDKDKYQETIEKGIDALILDLNTTERLFDNMDLDLNGELMPIVDKTPHIGIQRAYKDSASATTEENLKKARRSLYSLMTAGLHGENGLDPVTAISLVKTYIIPVMLYGLDCNQFS
ncbi:unnamed protein product [Mytilus coruscus]|uniref:Endonuclease/exonuclease/phosphatase domain-containing protein n=1 Tax=Mytilus coruscus TaxID=42192 RepID=A0A6J8E4B5_MYTCO|nr:unnamed protein product [Mytilus coruscus]